MIFHKMDKLDNLNLSRAITFLLFTYMVGCIKIRIVRKVAMGGKILTFRQFHYICFERGISHGKE
jgi:hypothetical protein